MGMIGEAAEAYVEALIEQGVEYLFLNPGTDTVPVQEALAKLTASGRPAPRAVLCLCETVALAAAHGYYAATGRPQAVLVHVDVGTQNLGGQIHNAQRGRAAVLISAGRAPYTTDRHQRGSRDTYIHWLQEQPDQHGIVRNYVKWDYELRRPEQVGEVVARAFQIAASDPPGPVYLSLPREVLMAPSGPVRPVEPGHAPPARLGAGDPAGLRDVARLLVASERPLILTATTGRTRAGFDGLRRLAELLALPVVEWRDRANFPAGHTLHQGYDPGPLLEAADLVLVLDHDVPYIPTQTGPPPGATVVQIDLDPIKEQIPLWRFPVTVPVRADTSQALDLLAAEATAFLTDAGRRRIEARREEHAARHRRQRSEWDAWATAAGQASAITLDWLGRGLEQLRREAPDCVFVDEAVTSRPALWRHVAVDEPGTWFGSGGSALGWGLAAALGVKLAHPGRPAVALVGDGSFVFGEPVAALWAAHSQAAPFLAVVCDNACYNATKQPLIEAYPQGVSVRTGRFVGVDLVPPPRYDLIAQSVGGTGERVERPAELVPALRRGLERVRAGQCAVVDVVLGRP
jgi:acetolactate synthase-1/2/3 large subunit